MQREILTDIFNVVSILDLVGSPIIMTLIFLLLGKIEAGEGRKSLKRNEDFASNCKSVYQKICSREDWTAEESEIRN